MGDSDFYVYVHHRLSDGKIFYVGKGRKKRAWSVYRSNPYWKNTVAIHGFRAAIYESGLSEKEAFALEKRLIAELKESGASLVNRTDGGDGVFSGEKAVEVCRKAGRIGGKIAGPIVGKRFAEEKIGVCAPGMASKGGKIGGKIAGKNHAENKTGVCAPGVSQAGGRASGHANGVLTKKLGIGAHAPGMASAGGKIGGKMPWWVCTETGKVTRAHEQPGGSFVRGRKCAA